MLSPSETMAEKPVDLLAAHSTKPAATAPDCEISAISPGCALCAAKLALSLACGARTPRQFGPTSWRPLLRAMFSQDSASEPGPCPIPAVTIIAVDVPFSPAAAMIAGTLVAGAAMTARSGG